MSATLTVVGEVFFPERWNVANVEPVLLFINVPAVVTRTMMTAELNATRACCLTQIAVKGRAAWDSVMSGRAEDWAASGLVKAVTSSTLDDRG